jgi:predicted metal-dependent hydrolase
MLLGATDVGLYELSDARVGMLETLIEAKRAILNDVLVELDRRAARAHLWRWHSVEEVSAAG